MTRTVKATIGALILVPLCCWAAMSWWQAAREVQRFYVQLPVWDSWDFVTHFARYKIADLRVLWIQHNEHRVVFPEIVAALDLLLFHGRFVMPTVVSFCLYFGIWAVMAWVCWRDREMPLIPRCAAILLAAILFAWKGCATALGIPFLLQWTMNQFVSILALLFLAKLALSQRLLWLLPLSICGIICEYSSGNGLLIWGLLLGLAILLRVRWQQVAILAAVGAVSSRLYFIGYKSLGPVNWRLILGHPVYLTQFMASYVSMPFAVLRAEPGFGVRVGLISLIGLLLLFVLAWRQRLLRTTAGIVLFGYSAVVLLAGLVTALGRMNPDDPLLQSPKALRYLTMPLTHWGVLAILAVWVTARSFRTFRFLSEGIALGLAICFGLLLFRMSHKPALDAWYRSAAVAFADQQWGALAVASGVLEQASSQFLFPDPGLVALFTPMMRVERLSLYSRPEPFWIGRNVKEVFPAPMQPAEAAGITASERLTTAIAVAGWASRPSNLNHPLRLVLVNEDNGIVGLGERLPAGLPGRFSKLAVPAEQQWTGFVNLAFPAHTVSLYAVTEDEHGLIPLTGRIEIEAAKKEAPQEKSGKI